MMFKCKELTCINMERKRRVTSMCSKLGIINKQAKLPNSRFCSSVLLSTKHKKPESFMN